MTLSEELSWRGFVNQTTFKDISDLDSEKRVFYLGMDPSADSLTIGNLAAAMMARHFMDYGYTPILLVGGATGMIGDPDGKKQERDLKTLDEIAFNSQKLSEQYKIIFADKDFETVNNYDWFKDLNYLTFLREIGKHASMTQMLDRDFVQKRIGEGGEGISYAEFSYSLIQGYDFLHLYREKGATLQLCGADQWGNSVTGVSLIRKLEGAEAHVYSIPLVVNKATGVKFGKSEGGAIWLDGNKTSPYKFYQFWLNLDDETAEQSVKYYTLLDRATVEALIENHRLNPGERALQKTIAHEVTTLIHGAQRCSEVERVNLALFGGSVSELSDEDLKVLATELPTANAGSTISEALVSAGVCASKGEARRLITGNAVSVNGEKISEDLSLKNNDLLKKGKNSFVLVRG